MPPEKLSIGIDLGTTNSCVAVFEGGDALTVRDKEGNATTPSYVAFSKNGRLIGKSAKIEALLPTGDVVYNIKRLIGRKYSDAAVQEDIQHLPFKVLSDNGSILIQIQNENHPKTYTPEEISAMILLEMKLIVCEEYDLPDTETLEAVITVPAYFNDAQRQATKDAGEIAGLKVLRIINEPTAAALAYRLDDSLNAETTVLVFDFGGGTLDVTILKIKKGTIMVQSTSGDTNLGGVDLDVCLREHFLAKHPQLGKAPKAIAFRLQASCQTVKHRLSFNSKETFSFSIREEEIVEMTLTRAEFERICKKVFDRILLPVQKALDDAKLDKSQIDDIVLVGGCSQIPKVRRVLEEFFNGKKVNCDINGDEAIARGAAIQAAIINQDASKVIEGLVMVDVATHTLGVNTSGKATMLIPRATPIPIQESKVFSTSTDNQTSVNIEVYEGEESEFAKNRFLGSFKLTHIPEAQAKVPKIKIVFEIDENGILNVTATEKMTGTQNAIRIEKNKWGLSEEDKLRMKNESTNFQVNDMKAKREKEIALFNLNNYLEREKKEISEKPLREMLSDSEIREIQLLIESTSDWVKDAQTNDLQVTQITQKQTIVSTRINGILEKYFEDE